MKHAFLFSILLLATFHLSAQEKLIPGITYLKKSNKYQERKEYTKALFYINKAIAKDSSNSFYYHNRSVIYSDLKEVQKAILDAKKAVDKNPSYASFHNTLASLYDLRNNPEDSSLIEKEYDLAVEFDPKDYLGFYNRGLFLRKRGKINEALRDFDKAKKIEPSFAEIYNAIASTKAFELKYYSEAMGDFNKAIELDPNNVGFYGSRGDCFLRLGNLTNAQKDISKALSIDPQDTRVLLLQAQLFSMTDKVPESLNILNKLIQKDSLSWEAYNQRGLMRIFQTQEYQLGIDDLKKALTIKPNEFIIHNNVGLGYVELNRYNEGIDEYNMAINNLPISSLAFSYNNRGYAKMKNHDFEGALTDINKSIKLDPFNSYAFRNRALVYLEMKKTEDACLDLARAQELKFDIFYGKEVQELLLKNCNK